MLAIIIQGGPIVMVICLLSIIGLYAVIEKLLFFRKHFGNSRKKITLIKEQLLSQGAQETVASLQYKNDILSLVIAQALRCTHLPKSEAHDRVKQYIYQYLPRLEFMMPVLSSIITAAPILGLTGTVLGLIDIFNVISGDAIGDAQALSAGISLALITTAAGLIVTIPLVFFYQFFVQRIDHHILQLEQYGTDIVDFCHTNNKTGKA